MLRSFLLLSVIVCVSAEELQPDNSTSYFPNISLPPMEAAIAQIGLEEMMARTYLDIVLKMQHATQVGNAAQMYNQIVTLESHEDYQMGDFEESSTLFTEHRMGGTQDSEQARMGLLASYYLYGANKVKFYQAIYKAGDAQMQFWKDRSIHIFIQAAAPTLPPQVLQIAFLKIFRTNLETLKVALNFQYISHFVTWLEDEMDVMGSLTDQTNPYGDYVVADQGDDLITDKLHAFSAYNSYAMIDFQTFLIDLYLEAIVGQAPNMGSFAPFMNSTNLTSSFLEEELEEGVEAEPAQPSQTKSFGPFANPLFLVKIYKFYYLMFQMNAARSALSSVSAEKLAFDQQAENPDELKTFAQQMFGNFATNLLYMSQMERFAASLQMFMLFMPVMAGSFGGGGGSI